MMEMASMIDQRSQARERAVLMGAYRRASDEGRLHPALAAEHGLPTGTARCPTCGMLAPTRHDAERCCIDEDRAHARPTVSTTMRYAAVVDRLALNIAVLDKMHAAGKKTMQRLSRVNGFGDRFLERFCTGEAKYIQRQSWESLCVMFDGPPPGCARVADDSGQAADNAGGR